MKFEQLFKTERFANAFYDNLSQRSNVKELSKEVVDNGTRVSYETKAEYEDKESKASETDVKEIVDQAVGYVYNEMQYMMQFVMAEIDYMWQWASKHSDGHLPNVQGSEQMERAVKGLGLDKEYQVAKKTIYAEDSWKSKDGTVIDSIQANVTK